MVRFKDQLKYVSMDYGEQYPSFGGITQMHKWCVDSWDMMDVSISTSTLIVIFLSLSQASFAFNQDEYTSSTPVIYHMKDIVCRGNETNILQCKYDESTSNCDYYPTQVVECHCKYIHTKGLFYDYYAEVGFWYLYNI